MSFFADNDDDVVYSTSTSCASSSNRSKKSTRRDARQDKIEVCIRYFESHSVEHRQFDTLIQLIERFERVHNVKFEAPLTVNIGDKQYEISADPDNPLADKKRVDDLLLKHKASDIVILREPFEEYSDEDDDRQEDKEKKRKCMGHVEVVYMNSTVIRLVEACKFEEANAEVARKLNKKISAGELGIADDPNVSLPSEMDDRTIGVIIAELQLDLNSRGIPCLYWHDKNDCGHPVDVDDNDDDGGGDDDDDDDDQCEERRYDNKRRCNDDRNSSRHGPLERALKATDSATKAVLRVTDASLRAPTNAIRAVTTRTPPTKSRVADPSSIRRRGNAQMNTKRTIKKPMTPNGGDLYNF